MAAELKAYHAAIRGASLELVTKLPSSVVVGFFIECIVAPGVDF